MKSFDRKGWNKTKPRYQRGHCVRKPITELDIIRLITESDAEHKLRELNERIQAAYGCH